MKVRWTHRSVRMRITPTELSALTEGGAVRETLLLGSGEWSAELRSGERSRLALEGTALTVELSAAEMAALTRPDAEGVYLRDEASGIAYIVEKDFPCAHPRPVDAHEPQTETFAAPASFQERKQGNPC